ncbi:MAG: hypothetical protein BGO11_19440 [Solirubrobacterales bacterium 70-9]|nr:MAG: hypothetical protein BGO11_19440 [Solirubrobacterales bacterium 70-9]
MALSKFHVEVPGGRVAVTSHGEGPDALVVVHGGPGCPSRYLSPLRELATPGRRVVFWDQLGCGDSEGPDDASLWTMDRFVLEMAAVVEATGLTKVDVFGHSWGGMLAQQFALDHPAKVRRLVVASSAAASDTIRKDSWALADALPAPHAAAIRAGEESGDRRSPHYRCAVRAFHARHMCLVEYPEDVAVSFRETAMNVLDALLGPSDFSIDNRLRDWDIRSRLGSIEAPVLVTCGRHDQARPESARALAARLPRGRLQVFEKSAHLAFWEERDTYLAALASFLEAPLADS